MKILDIIITDPEGLHARPASRLVSLCHNYDADIAINFGGMRANGKNITEVLALGAEKDDRIEIEISGNDASAAEHALRDLFDGLNSGMEKME